MSELPEPLSPPDCYLGGYDFMPLLGRRLFASRFYGLALKNPRAGIAAMKLWWLAFSEQRPAGSLPNDEVELARMADFGTDLRAWRRHAGVALAGFRQCSDGRLYHPVLCNEAVKAFVHRNKERQRKAAYRSQAIEKTTSGGTPAEQCPAGQDADGDGDVTGTETGTGRGRPAQTRQDRTRQDRKKDSEASPLPSAPAPEPLPSARDRLWREGLPIVQHLTGKPPSSCRSLLGKMLRDAKDDAPRVLFVLQQAQDLQPADPVAWFSAAMRERQSQVQPLSQTDELRKRWKLGTFLAPLVPVEPDGETCPRLLQ